MMRRNQTEVYDEINLSPTSNDVYISDDDGFHGHYDLTPLNTAEPSVPMNASQQPDLASPCYSIDPWESMSISENEGGENEEFSGNDVAPK